MAAAKPPQLGPWREKPTMSRKECAVLTVGTVLLVTGSISLTTFVQSLWDPVFTVAITGVTGLDPDVVDPPTTSPPPANNSYYSIVSPPPPPLTTSPVVFNLTFQIANGRFPYNDGRPCVPGLSRADVSYGGAFLAGVSLPHFCAAGEKRPSGRVAVRAWGDGAAVPRLLRDQVAAGGAMVDVKVTIPTYCQSDMCGVVSCKAKIGGGGTSSAPACRLDCSDYLSLYLCNP